MNTNCAYTSYQKQKGFLLVAALGFIVAFSFLVFVVTQKMMVTSNTQLLSLLSIQSTNAAKSGLEEGAYLLTKQQQAKQFCETMNLTKQFNQIGLKNCSVNTSCNVNSENIRDEDFTKSIFVLSTQARCGSDALYAIRAIDMALLVEKDTNGKQNVRKLYQKYW